MGGHGAQAAWYGVIVVFWLGPVAGRSTLDTISRGLPQHVNLLLSRSTPFTEVSELRSTLNNGSSWVDIHAAILLRKKDDLKTFEIRFRMPF